MQVLRNIYKSRRLAIDDDAYNLPLDTIYFIESKWNYRLNGYVREHKMEIEQLLCEDIGGFFPYKFEIVSIDLFQNPLIQNAFSELHPEIEREINFSSLVDSHDMDKEQVYQSTMLQRMMTKPYIFEETFITRLLPSEREEGYGFYAIDISMCSESLILEILSKYIRNLHAINLSILSKQDALDYDIHDEVLDKNALSFGRRLFSFCGALPQGLAESLVGSTEINKLNINPQLKDLVWKLKENIDSYQRTNGINVLLENQFEEFIKSFENFEVKPLSTLNIDNRFNIYLTEYKKEIRMYTLPKTLYFFFLRHPQGIYLKDISDYRDELKDIYILITRQSISHEEAYEKIDNLVDLSTGILNQYICRISEAFRNELSTDLAKHYSIAGKRNELRHITLDTSKVTLPENLKCLTATLRL